MIEPITYAGGGMLGDFIHQLSVVQENFLTTGRKGRVYVSNRHESFRFGVERAHADLSPILSGQDYVESFHPHADESFDVDLGAWRQSPLLFRADWRTVFETTYTVPWGAHKWLTLPENEEYANAILVGTKKWQPAADWEFLRHLPGALFVTDNQEELDHLQAAARRNLSTKLLPNLYELYRAIHSCRLFVGALSAPLAAAMAAHRPCVYLRSHAVGPDVCDVCVEGLPWTHFRVVDRDPVREIKQLLEAT